MPKARSASVSIGFLIPAASALLVAACQPLPDTAPAPIGPDQMDVVWSAIDRTAPACTNFYQHACGAFIASVTPTEEIPEISLFERAYEANLETALTALFKEPAASGSELGRLKTFYNACLDQNASGAEGDEELVQGWLGRIDAITDRSQLVAMIAALDRVGVEPLFVYDMSPDPKDWSRWHGLLDRPDLYADEGVIRAFLQASGTPAAASERQAAAVAALSDRLKRAGKSDSLPFGQSYEKSWSEIETLAPGFDWTSYRKTIGAPAQSRIEIGSPAYLGAVAAILREARLDDIKAYLRWRFLLSFRGELPMRYAAAVRGLPVHFGVSGSNATKRCRDATVRGMGVAFSRQFATHILGDEARAEATKLSEEIRESILQSIDEDTWLSPAGLAKSKDKLRKLDLRIGFPERWPETGTYPIRPGKFFANVLAAREFNQQQKWLRARAARDPGLWQEQVYPWVGIGMASERLTIPNGFPDVYSNSLVMTAAFLLPPRFSASASVENNLGVFGSVFGHELTHVLEIHQFDAEGRPNEIWSGADVAAHKAQQQCVVDQANAHVPAPGLKSRGEEQLDENVADLGGVRLSHLALMRHLGASARTQDRDGTTPEQRFFYRYAQQYCVAQTPGRLKAGVEGDPHGPAEFRVNGPLQNLPAFSKAFGCRQDDAMVRPVVKICRVW